MGDNVIELEIASCPEANHPARPLTVVGFEEKIVIRAAKLTMFAARAISLRESHRQRQG
ncbi:MAG: hypothetical protein WCF79_16660 [Rhodomicrobium sp.]|jgi:hypothetical protein